MYINTSNTLHHCFRCSKCSAHIFSVYLLFFIFFACHSVFFKAKLSLKWRRRKIQIRQVQIIRKKRNNKWRSRAFQSFIIIYFNFHFFFNFIAQEIKICLFYAFVLVVLGFCRIMQSKTFLSIEVNQ